jgi:hypothetical protein
MPETFSDNVSAVTADGRRPAAVDAPAKVVARLVAATVQYTGPKPAERRSP